MKNVTPEHPKNTKKPHTIVHKHSKNIDMPCFLLYIGGDASGIGKSTTAIGLLHLFHHELGYPYERLGYIKPITQCIDPQLIEIYCKKYHVQRAPAVIVFKKGYTQQAIDGQLTSYESRCKHVYNAVQELAKKCDIVVVDGVGYPAVGSTCGMSNADVARILGAPVIVVGRPGIGNAIDAMEGCRTFFEANGAKTIGAIWNKLPHNKNFTGHSYDECTRYVKKFYETQGKKKNTFRCYGFVPNIEEEEEEDSCRMLEKTQESKNTTSNIAEESRDDNEKMMECIGRAFTKYVDIKSLMDDLEEHYSEKKT